MKKTLILLASTLVFAQTDKSGPVLSNETWSFQGSPYTLTGAVQVANGVTLTIAPGVEIIGDNKKLEIFGVLNAIGKADSMIVFNSAVITPGSTSSNENHSINIDFAKINEGKLYPATGNAVYGNLTLKNSLIKNLKDYLYLWYPTSECVIEKNVFYNSGRIETMTRNANIRIDNNFFRNDVSESSSVTGYAVQNAATYESSSTTLRKNTFFNTDKVAISLPSGYTSAKIDAKENFWNTTTESVIESMIHDKDDDLNSASLVDYSSFLTSADLATPTYNVLLKVPSEYSTIQAAIDFAVSGDTILIDSGTYYESLTINSDHGIVVMGENAKTTIVDGSKTGRALFINNSPNNVIKNLTFQNGVSPTDDTHGGGGVQIDKSENTTLANLIFKNNYSNYNGSAISIIQEITKKPTNIINVLAHNNNGPNTFYSYGGKTNIINSTFFNNQPKDIPTSARIDIAFKDRCCDQGESRVRVLNSIIGGGIRKHGDSQKASHFTAVNSYLARRDTLLLDSQDVISKSNEHFKVILGGSDEWVLTPVFVDSADGDYRLADYSPGIGYGLLSYDFDSDGTVVSIPVNDLSGSVRPSSLKPDIGAYENKYDTPQNAPPVLSTIQDVSVNEDESITVTIEAINAKNLDSDPISFSASSEKDAVKINIGSTSGKLDISANSNWNGPSKISVSATDGKAFDYGNFTVNFIPVNDKLELQAIDPYSTDEEVAKSITVTATDVDGDPLSLSATTSTNEVIPSVDGMQLTLTPAKDFVGSANVKVVVSDGALTDTVQYIFTVLNVNDAPVQYEIKDQIISEDTRMKIKVFATDVDDSSISFSGNSENTGVVVSASTDSIKLQPETDWFGSSVITVYASDGKDTDSTKFTLKVNPMQDPPFEFEWISAESDSVVVSQQNLANTYNLEWSESIDVDKEGIDYLVYAKIGVYEKELIYDTTATELPITYLEIVENVFESIPGNGATVTFSVSATDRIDTVHVKGSDRVLYVNRYDYLSTQSEGVPSEFVLHANYPNPFNPTTQIRFDLPEMSNATLTIYNMIGQKIRTFNMQSAPAGYHSLTWNATNDYGQQVSAGVYLYQLQTKGFTRTKKMILLK